MKIVSFNKIFFFLLLGTAFSCIPNKRLIYLQNLEGQESIADGELIRYEIPEYRLQYNDIIEVNVLTADDFITKGFSSQQMTPMGGMMGQMAQGGGDVYYMTGFTVNKDGNIHVPFVGDVQVMNRTIEEARQVIEEKLRKELIKSEFHVRVKLGGIRFSTIGEFRRPGKYVVLQDRMTIFEAIAQAGDLNNLAKRDEILLIRQYPDGSKLHRINLNDRQLVRSPFYFIQPNDQLYAEPMKVRQIGAGENAAQSLTLLISSISAVALVLNLLTR